MTLKQLEYFSVIAETGSITAAAKNLNISQPPLSYQLKSLEGELGVSLFTRTGSHMKITQEGLILKERSQEILSLINDTLCEIQHKDNTLKGTIRLGTVTSIANRLLPSKVLSYKKNNPQIRFQLIEGNSLHIMDLLNNDIIDFGLIREPFDMSLYNTLHLDDPALEPSQTDYFVALAKPEFFDTTSDLLTLSDLKEKPLIIHKRYERLIINSCVQKGFSPQIVCENNDILSSISWAEAGIGIAIAPYTSSMLASKDSLIRKKIIEPTINSKAYLIWHKERSLPIYCQNFLNLFSVI